MPRKSRGPGRSLGDAERRIARDWLNKQAIIHSRRACWTIIILVAVFGILLPMAQFTPILLAVIALALGTASMVVFAFRAETATSMFMWTMLATAFLAVMFTVEVLVTNS